MAKMGFGEGLIMDGVFLFLENWTAVTDGSAEWQLVLWRLGNDARGDCGG